MGRSSWAARPDGRIRFFRFAGTRKLLAEPIRAGKQDRARTRHGAGALGQDVQESSAAWLTPRTGTPPPLASGPQAQGFRPQRLAWALVVGRTVPIGDQRSGASH